MASTASLLFNIAANADEAESTVQSFRALMGKNLSDISGEFDQWSKDVFGSLDTVGGAMTAIGAASAAALVAAVAFSVEATNHYKDYVGEVAQAMRVTGQSAETMSALHFAAAETHTSFESLSTGLVRFEGNVVKGAEGNTQLLGSFQKLGVSQADLKAGETDLVPLLGKVMDGFHGMTSGVDRAAVARALFSRNGTDLLGFLMKGSAGLKEFEAECEKLGLTIHNKDVEAFRELQAAEEKFKAQQEALDVVIGQKTIPIWTKVKTLFAATASAAQHGELSVWGGLLQWGPKIEAEYRAIGEEIKKQVAISQGAPPPPLTAPDTAPKLEKVKENYEGISTVLEALRGKIASLGGHDTQLAFEMSKYKDEIDKATVELGALQKAGKITADAAARESSALALLPAAMTALWQQEWDKQIAANYEAAQQKIADDLKAENDLRGKLAAISETGFDGQRQALARETDTMRENYKERGQLTAEMWDLINQVYIAGMAKIDAAEKADQDKQDAAAAAESQRKNEQLQSDLSRLEEHQEQILAQHMTGQQKLKLDYQKDLQEFSAVEEAKALKAAQSEAEIALVHQRYADLRTAITTKYGQDLQTLQNSQGWQGVFGSKFEEMLKGNQQLLRQWQQSTNQSLMLVQVTLQAMKQMVQDTFKQFADAMGNAAVQALVQGKSIETAMQATLSATLESLAGQAAAQAIYALGWAFLDLAEGDTTGASMAFESAAIFGALGVAAGVTGALIAPSSSSSGGAGGSGGSGTSGGSGAGGSANGAIAGSGASSGQQQPYVQINVAGHVIGPSGVSELADMFNQAVYNNNMQLYASANASGTKLP